MKRRRNMTERTSLEELYSGQGEHTLEEALMGSGLPPAQREILAEGVRAFGGGGAGGGGAHFTRQEWMDNTTPRKRSLAGRTLSAMVRKRIAREVSPGRFEITKHGEEVAYGDTVGSAESDAESALATAIEDYDSDYRPEREPRTRTIVEPHAAAGKRPCKLCKIRHRLKEHRHHKIDGKRIQCSLVGCGDEQETGSPSFDFGALAPNPTRFPRLKVTMRRRLAVAARKAAAILGVPVSRVTFRRIPTPRGFARGSVFVLTPVRKGR